MSLSMMALSLNENITNEQFIRLNEKHIESMKSVTDSFLENFDKIEDRDMKIEYMNACLPLLMQFYMS